MFSTVRLLQSLEEAAISSECWSLFWDRYVPQHDCVEDDITLNWGHPTKWLEVVNELPGDEPCSKLAFSALIMSQVSKDSRDQQLAEASTLLYGNALKDLQAALRDSERVYSDEILIASLSLALYEAFQGSTIESSSWLSHAQGAARLIELRGPERHRTDHAHQFFLASRISTIYAGILQRKASYLAAKEWRTVPWESQRRTYFDRLVDLATELPALLERLDSLDTGSPDLRDHKSRLLREDFLAMQKATNTWKHCTNEDTTGQEYTYIATEQEDAYPFETKLWFDNHIFANAASLHHTYSLVISEAIEALRKDQHTDNEEVSRDHATCIAKMIPYCLQADMGGFGPCIINFPANIALQYFERTGNSSVTSWLMKMFNKDVHTDSNVGHAFYDVQKPRGSLETASVSPPASSDSSDGTSEVSGRSTSSAREPNRVIVKFVHEDPSRHYTDTSENSSQAGQPATRSRCPPPRPL